MVVSTTSASSATPNAVDRGASEAVDIITDNRPDLSALLSNRIAATFDPMSAEPGDYIQPEERALRGAMLAAGISGRLVPPDPSDRAASAWPEQITAGRAASKPSRRREAPS